MISTKDYQKKIMVMSCKKFTNMKFLVVTSIFMILTIFSCRKPLKDTNEYYPKVSSVTHTVNLDQSITFTAHIEDPGAADIEYVGMHFSLTGEPTENDQQVLATLNGDVFSATIYGITEPDGSYFDLDHESSFYVKAFATNQFGWSWSQTYKMLPWEIPTVEAPCTPSNNTFNFGNGVMSAFVSGPSTATGGYVYTLNGSFGDSEFRFNQPIHTGIYTTSLEGTFLQSNEVQISFTYGNYHLVSAGASVYVNETSPDVFDVTVCSAPWSGTGTYTARFTANG
jgi:hypothetical protein